MNLLRTDRPFAFSVARDATTRDAIYRFRYDTLVGKLRRELPGVDHENGWMRDPWDDTGILAYAAVDGRVVGTIRVNEARAVFRGELDEQYCSKAFGQFYPERSVLLSRLVIAEEAKGIGTLSGVLKQAYLGSLHLQAQFAFSHCRPNLLPIMEHSGNLRCGPDFVGVNGVEYTPIVICLRAYRFHLNLNTWLAEFLTPDMENTDAAKHFYHWMENTHAYY